MPVLSTDVEMLVVQVLVVLSWPMANMMASTSSITQLPTKLGSGGQIQMMYL
jgi:hypothetical protein